MSDNYLPLRNYESMALQFLYGLSQEAGKATSVLKQRADATGQTEKLGNIAKDSENVADAMLATLPPEKQRTFFKNLNCQQMEIHIKRVAHDDDSEFTYVPTEALRALCGEASRGKCALCLGTVDDAKRCKFRKVLKQVLMIDPEPTYFGCEYHDLDWSDS